MAKPEQVLVIDPAGELTFTGPFTSAVSSVMKLTNPADRRVAFKIKTTAPKRYCVKPNSGVIEPAQTVQISVSLQPFEYDPTEKNRHKFMVQSMFVPEGEINQDSLWKDTDNAQLMDSRLKCVFILPSGEDSSVGAGSGYASDSSKATDFYNVKSSIPPSPKMSVNDNDLNLKRTVDEIKKLQEEVSALRQENIQLKEDALRQKRLAGGRGGDAPVSAASASVSESMGGGAVGEHVRVSPANPAANALSTVYLYAALVILILGVIIGKWIL